MRVITFADVERTRASSPKRARFSEFPIIKKRPDGTYSASLKFPSLARLFEVETGIYTRDGMYDPYCYIDDKAQITAALKWQQERESYVFVRDNLGLSVAVDMNLREAAVYSDLGKAEHDAKASRDTKAIKALEAACLATIKHLMPLREADAICAVPPSPEKDWDLPTELAGRIAAKCGKTDISAASKFSKKKDSVKSLSLADKWSALDAAGLQASRKAVAGKRVILLDDKYQSGTTAQFAAAKLLEAGAQEVYGLFCVKTWRDTDNK